LEAEQAILKQQFEEAKSEQKRMRQAIARAVAVPSTLTDNTFSPALAAWLFAGKFSTIPEEIVPELRERLGLSDNGASDFVLVSKATMQNLRPSSPRKDDALPDSLCALLSIGPEQKTQIESLLTRARQDFTDWARKNLQRTGPN